MWNKIAAIRLMYWLLIAAGVFLLIMAFRQCNNLPSHRGEGKSMDSVAVALAAKEKAGEVKLAALTRQKDSLQHIVDTTQKQLQAVRKDLSARAIAVLQNLANGSQAIGKHDTLWRLQNCDSLRAQVAAGLPVVIAQDSLSQETIAACMAEGAVKDSIAASYLDLWQTTKTAYSQQRAAYVGLLKDYNKANGRLKFNKTMTRGLAIALLAAGLKIFVFK